MTTIVYKDGIIAYDSRITGGDMILDDNYNKKKTVGGRIYFFCGNTLEYPAIVKLYEGGEVEFNNNASALVVEPNGELFIAVANKGERFFKQFVEKHETEVLGSGIPHAYTAMDMGADAKLAVKMAIKRDLYSGGKIRTFKMTKTPKP